MSLLLGAFRASRCTADAQKNHAADQEGSHHGYEASLANHGAPASPHVSLATSTPKHATPRTLAPSAEAYSSKCVERLSGKSLCGSDGASFGGAKSRRLVVPSSGAYPEFPDNLWKGYAANFAGTAFSESASARSGRVATAGREDPAVVLRGSSSDPLQPE